MSELKQAMILAAGYSTRLKPLTNRVPKPMLPFLGRTVFDQSLEYLEANSIGDIAVNVHHGKNEFSKMIRNLDGGKRIRIFEEEEILGTGGGISNMRTFVQDEHFLVINCDFLTDVEIAKAFDFHLKKKSLATMVLRNDPSRKYGSVRIDKDGRLTGLKEDPNQKTSGAAFMFTGIHIFHRSIFDRMPKDRSFFCINSDVYTALIQKREPVFGFVCSNRWMDLGELDLFADTQFQLAARPMPWMKSVSSEYREAAGGQWVHKTYETPLPQETNGPLWIGKNVRIGRGAQLGPRAIIGNGVRLGDEVSVSDAVLYPNVDIPGKSRIRSEIVFENGGSVGFRN